VVAAPGALGCGRSAESDPRLVAAVSLLAIGTVPLEDGSSAGRFLCESLAALAAPDVTHIGGGAAVSAPLSQRWRLSARASASMAAVSLAGGWWP
jgi:hypothetical protein